MSQSPKHLRVPSWSHPLLCFSKHPLTDTFCEHDADHSGDHSTWAFDQNLTWVHYPQHAARRTSFLWPAAEYTHTGFEVGAL